MFVFSVLGLLSSLFLFVCLFVYVYVCEYALHRGCGCCCCWLLLFWQSEVFFLHLFLVFFCLFLFALQQMLARIRFDVRSISFIPNWKTTNSASVLVSFDFFFLFILRSYRFSSVGRAFHFVWSFFSLRLIRFSFGSFDLNWFLLTICFYCIQNWSLCCFFVPIWCFYSFICALVFRFFSHSLQKYTSSIQFYTFNILDCFWFYAFVPHLLFLFGLFVYFRLSDRVENDITWWQFFFHIQLTNFVPSYPNEWSLSINWEI